MDMRKPLGLLTLLALLMHLLLSTFLWMPSYYSSEGTPGSMFTRASLPAASFAFCCGVQCACMSLLLLLPSSHFSSTFSSPACSPGFGQHTWL